MPDYDQMQVCLNGHKITEYARSQLESQQKHCAKCGAATIMNCPHTDCSKKIRGQAMIFRTGGYRLNEKTPPPSHCESCGRPFPWWTEPAVEASSELDLDHLSRLLSRFPRYARLLKERLSGRAPFEIKDEYDVQDALKALLATVYDDVRPEECTPSHAGKGARVDFLLKIEATVLEIKMTRTGLADAKIGEELVIDIARYRTHPNCKRLVCFVYDPEHHIKNPAGLIGDLETHTTDALQVRVFIAPQ